MKGGNIDAWLTLKAKTYESGHCEDCFKKTCHTKKMLRKISNSQDSYCLYDCVYRLLGLLRFVQGSKHVCRLSGTTTMFPPTSAPIHHPSPWRVRLMSQDVFDAFLLQKDTENQLAANVMVPTENSRQVTVGPILGTPRFFSRMSRVPSLQYLHRFHHFYDLQYLFRGPPFRPNSRWPHARLSEFGFSILSAIFRLSISLISQHLPVSNDFL